MKRRGGRTANATTVKEASWFAVKRKLPKTNNPKLDNKISKQLHQLVTPDVFEDFKAYIKAYNEERKKIELITTSDSDEVANENANTIIDDFNAWKENKDANERAQKEREEAAARAQQEKEKAAARAQKEKADKAQREQLKERMKDPMIEYELRTLESGQDSVVPILLTRMESWMGSVWHAVGRKDPSFKPETFDESMGLAMRFMHEGIYDMMDVVVDVMTALPLCRVPDPEDEGQTIKIMPRGVRLSDTITYLTTLRDVFQQTRYAYTPERIETLLLDGGSSYIQGLKKDPGDLRSIQQGIYNKLKVGDPDRMLYTAWKHLGMEAEEIPETWKPYLEALESHAKVMYATSLYVSQELAAVAGPDPPDPAAAYTFDKHMKDDTKIAGQNQFLGWRLGFLWRTPDFQETNDTSQNKKSYEAWVKEPRPGMLQTLGVLYYAMLTTLARIKPEGEDPSNSIDAWKAEINRKREMQAKMQAEMQAESKQSETESE